MSEEYERRLRALQRNARNRRRRKLGGKLLHPEVVNRRRSAGGKRTAELIRNGTYHLPVPGMGWKTTLKGSE